MMRMKKLGLGLELVQMVLIHLKAQALEIPHLEHRSIRDKECRKFRGRVSHLALVIRHLITFNTATLDKVPTVTRSNGG